MHAPEPFRGMLFYPNTVSKAEWFFVFTPKIRSMIITMPCGVFRIFSADQRAAGHLVQDLSIGD